MAKMRKFLFWNDEGIENEREAISLKKAVRSVQSEYKDTQIAVQYISKKGQEMCHYVLIPMGRKIRQAIITENRRLAKKAKLEAARA
jgi:hypothetical protein